MVGPLILRSSDKPTAHEKENLASFFVRMRGTKPKDMTHLKLIVSQSVCLGMDFAVALGHGCFHVHTQCFLDLGTRIKCH